DGAEGGDERECERDTAEVRRDTTEREERRPEQPRRSWRERCVGDQEPERAAEDSGDEADLDALDVRVKRRALEDVPDELGRVLAVLRPERADEERPRGHEQERDRPGEEGHKTEPGKRKTPSGPPRRGRPDSVDAFSGGRQDLPRDRVPTVCDDLRR